MKVLKLAKFSNPIMVNEQKNPDPNFPTTKFPNPEEPGVMDLAIKYAKDVEADLVIANDPDADRCAIAVKSSNGNWRTVRGDEVGTALGKYLIDSHNFKNKSVANSLVSSTLLSKIAKHNQINFFETLTGFKWISKIPNLAFGYEEALGYCVDPEVVNDKDGISAAVLIAQLIDELKNKGKSFDDYLDDIGVEFGFHATDQISVRVDDLTQIDKLLSKIISDPPSDLAGYKIESVEDLNQSKDLKTTGIRLRYSGEIRVIIRPSGTEPKLKCYIEVVKSNKSESLELISQIKEVLTKVLS
jgi:phosphomannomutase